MQVVICQWGISRRVDGSLQVLAECSGWIVWNFKLRRWQWWFEFDSINAIDYIGSGGWDLLGRLQRHLWEVVTNEVNRSFCVCVCVWEGGVSGW